MKTINEITYTELENALENEILIYGEFFKMSLFWLASQDVECECETELVRVIA